MLHLHIFYTFSMHVQGDNEEEWKGFLCTKLYEICTYIFNYF